MLLYWNEPVFNEATSCIYYRGNKSINVIFYILYMKVCKSFVNAYYIFVKAENCFSELNFQVAPLHGTLPFRRQDAPINTGEWVPSIMEVHNHGWHKKRG
jgi:hypothetical protein